MENKQNEFNISTRKRYELVDITDRIERTAGEGGINEGLVLVFVAHSTCAILLTENEEGLKNDWLSFLEKTVSGFNFQHNLIDNNAESHILSGLLGQGKILPIEKGRLVRGTWQQIFLAEFDGPKDRKVRAKIIGS